MADDINISLNLDTKPAEKSLDNLTDKGAQAGNALGRSFNKRGNGLQNLTDTLDATRGGLAGVAETALRATGPYGALALAAGAAAASFGALALAGEKVNAVNAQFANVARSAGLEVDSFTESIIKSTDGLIDDENALQIATKGIIALGDNAAKIPEILDASRSVSRALGKDFEATFGDLSQFVETGNARILRQFGLILDLDGAYQKAAKSIGLTVAQLTEQQKQTIRTNLLLDQVPAKFGAAASSVTPLADAFDRLRVKANNSLESVQTGVADFITKRFIDENDLSNVGFNRLTDELQKNQKELNAATARLDQLRATPQKDLEFGAGAEVKALSNQIDLLRAQNERLAVQASGLSDAQLFADLDKARSQTAPGPDKDAIKRNAEQDRLVAEQNRARLNDLSKFIQDQDKLSIESENKRLDTITNNIEKENAFKAQFTQQAIALEQQKNNALALVSEQFSINKGFTDEQRNAAELAVKNNFFLQEEALARAQAEKLKAIEDEKNFSLLTSSQTYFAGFTEAAESFRNKASENFKEVGKQAFQSIGRGVASSFAAYGAALKNGEDASEAFLESTLKFFGDLAVNIGSYYVALGAAKLFGTPADKADALPLIAAGAALSVLGGVLGASSGSSAKPSTGGGIAAEPGTVTDFVPPEQAVAQEPNTQVQVVIQGDVLDSDASSIRIVELINSAFDKQGVVIQRGALA